MKTKVILLVLTVTLNVFLAVYLRSLLRSLPGNEAALDPPSAASLRGLEGRANLPGLETKSIPADGSAPTATVGNEMQNLTADQLRDAFLRLRALPPSALREQSMRDILERLGELNGGLAMQLASMDPGENRLRREVSALAGWARSEPQQAWARVLVDGDKSNDLAANSAKVAAIAGSILFTASVEELMELASTTDSNHRAAATGLLMNAAQFVGQYRPSDIPSFVAGISADPKLAGALSSVVGLLGQTLGERQDRDEALAFALNVSQDSKVRINSIGSVFRALGYSWSPAEAANWFDGASLTSAEKDLALRSFLPSATVRDPAMSSTLFSRFSGRDALEKGISQSIALLQLSSPSKAYDWVLSIGLSESTRADKLKGVVQYWTAIGGADAAARRVETDRASNGDAVTDDLLGSIRSGLLEK